MDATLDNFLNVMVARGKITEQEANEKRTKHEKKEKAKKAYKKNGKRMKKDELVSLLNDLTS